MRSCIIVYDGVNILDFARIYDIFVKCGIEFVVIGFRGLTSVSDPQVFITPTTKNKDGYDIVAIPGGSGAEVWADDGIFVSWMRSSEESKDIISLNNGSKILDGAKLNGVKFSSSKAILEWIKSRS